MIIKIYNAFLKISIFVLLVLSLWLVVNGALKESKGHFEFGNLMDFFNTLGTIGTLWVAYLVYKNAPIWINQKLDDHALNVARDLIMNDIPTVTSKLRNISSHISTFRSYSVLTDFVVGYKDLEIYIPEIREDLKYLKENAPNIKIKFDLLEKLGWKRNEKSLIPSIEIIKSINNNVSFLSQFNEKTIIIESKGNTAGESGLKLILFNMAETNGALFKQVQNDYDLFISSAELIPHYFNIKNLKN